MELIQQLTQQLGINQQQASGGLGLIMGEAKERLGGDFDKVAQHVPGVDNLISSAPRPNAGPAAGGLGGALGAVTGMLGGQGRGGGAGSIAKLAGGFGQLGLDPGMIGRFLPIVMNFFQQKGGAPTRGLLERALA